MKRAFAWMAGIVGIAALGRWLAHRQARRRPEAVEPDPADELRRRLAEQRTAEQETAEEEVAEAADERSLEERRADVHAKAQEAIDAMRDAGF